MTRNWSWRMPLCLMLALAAIACTQGQADNFFAELPPTAAPEVLIAAPSPSVVPAAAPAEVIVPATPAEAPVAAPAEVPAAAPAEVPAAAPTPSQETFAPPVTYTYVDLSDTPFSSIQVCWPFNTYIIPADNYTLDIQAEDVVLGAINLNVTDDGTLELWTEGDFRTPYPVIAIVSLPFDSLSGVFVPSPSAEVTVGPGFVADNFTASAPFSSQDLNVLSLTADTLRVQSSGLGRIYVDGIIGNATIAASGSGDVYVIGLEDTAVLNLAGTVTANIQATNESAIITGQASGINTVLYQMGSCFVTTPFLFGSPCQQTDYVDVPTIDPLWSCGLRVTGNFTCPAGGIQLAQRRAAAGLLPLAAAVTRVPSPPLSPPPSLPPPSPIFAAAGGGAAVSPPVTEIPTLQPPPPLFFASPSPNIVSRVGSGPQFAGASGTGTQVANAVSGPGLQQQNLGTNSPVPDLFNTPGFTDGFGGFGKRRLQQSLSSSSSSGGQSIQTSSSGVLQSKSTRPYPCYYDVLGGGFDALRIFPNGP
ncbi:hypothetical protein COCSUDRAFT_40265 [Coccomyxa subellipsoidea C-169]|uniref:Putative auto-transporter adhesin head GIN domain-containing protein n=1 Tax=Coccomyxa subellipsoidea (strain C-169) TaxID=574566 RepID=I0Z640_COCSC|nr:hypothetical protein COCSUDRAFT_40265 [Coccomyxa subellipsoidea C-169]EIE26109.1 hypothetical protein COCSUDRAFT_40265 [Coccomyxa subellipsoidea C-169]|eukprot:XP_005650653.1 hypothetical protein COCSUDRAFT_40265 [Coccomyxa subellipsoidea C-169]